jgi:fructoselysine-6-P-deglycase FrlB-like protein
MTTTSTGSTSHLQREVASQPADWRAVQGRVDEARDALPATGASVAVVGCGTSWFMAQAYAAAREAAGLGRTEAHAASELPPTRRFDHVVAISRSGTTSEVVDVLTSLRERGTRTTAIVATAGTAVPRLADRTILLPEADEQSVVQTRFATTTLALLRGSLGEDLSQAVADAEAVLSEDAGTVLAHVDDADQYTFLGHGWTVGLAAEAALKLRESAQLWTESYPAMEYRHGPISIATRGRVVWALGDVPAGLEDDVARTGAHLEHRAVDPLAELVRVHRLCLLRAERAGLDPDRPRHLTRSVVLP